MSRKVKMFSCRLVCMDVLLTIATFREITFEDITRNYGIISRNQSFANSAYYNKISRNYVVILQNWSFAYSAYLNYISKSFHVTAPNFINLLIYYVGNPIPNAFANFCAIVIAQQKAIFVFRFASRKTAISTIIHKSHFAQNWPKDLRNSECFVIITRV